MSSHFANSGKERQDKDKRNPLFYMCVESKQFLYLTVRVRISIL